MLFEIAKDMGQIELKDNGFDVETDLVGQIIKNPKMFMKLPKIDEVLYLQLYRNEIGLLSFKNFSPLKASEKEVNIEEKLMFKKGREQGGDFSYTANFYLQSYDEKKKVEENLHSVFMKRFLDTKMTQDEVLEKIKNKDSNYYQTVLPIKFFFKFMSFVLKKNFKDIDILNYLYEVDTLLSEHFDSHNFINQCDLEVLKPKSKKEKEKWLIDNFNSQTIYNYFYELFKVKDLMDDFNGLFLSKAKNKEFAEVRRYISISINDNDDTLYQNDFPVFKELFIESLLYNFSNGGKDLGHGTCSICLENHKDLYGSGISDLKSPFSQYSVFKSVYISNGLDSKKNVDNFPVCIDCLLKIQIGAYSIKSTPFKTMFNKVPTYILPYSSSKDIFESFYKEMKKAKYGKDERDSVSFKEINYNNMIKKLAKEKKLNFLGKSLEFEDGVSLNQDIGFYLMVVDEPNQNTNILKTEKNISLVKINMLNNIIEQTAKEPYFKTFIKDNLAVNKEYEIKQYDFLNYLKIFNTYENNMDNFNNKSYINLITNIYAFNKVNIDKLLKESMLHLAKTFRNEKDLYKTTNEFDKIYFVLNVLKKSQKPMEVLTVVKDMYNVSYSGDDRNFEKKILEAAKDANLLTDMDKALFILGLLTKRITLLQKRKNLSGDFVSHMYRPLKNSRDVIKLYNKVSEMFNNKYKDDLGYLTPTLQLLTSLLPDIHNHKFSKDNAYYNLNLGFQIENRFITNKENMEEDNHE